MAAGSLPEPTHDTHSPGTRITALCRMSFPPSHPPRAQVWLTFFLGRVRWPSAVVAVSVIRVVLEVAVTTPRECCSALGEKLQIDTKAQIVASI
jgi:hypothetical protein